MTAAPSTIADLLRSQRGRGDHPLLICDSDRISYAEAERRSARLARGLIGLGAGKGTHVGLLYPNGVEFLIGMLAAARIGAVVIPYSTFLTTTELCAQLVDSDTAIMLAARSYRSHDYAARFAEILDGTTPPLLRHLLLDIDELGGQVDDDPLLTACGKPFDGMDVRITDADTGAPMPVGTPGIIEIRGPHVMRGICRRPREDVFTPDGYYPTGDLGHLDNDGFLFYHGRSDAMFKVRGATVYPSEVEKALRSFTGVHGVWATNIAGPQGDRVGAAVVCDTESVSVETLRRSAGAVLSSFKVPTVWLLADDDSAIPRLASGKVDVPRLRTLLTAATTPPPTDGDR